MSDSYIFGDDIPATAEDALAHYGVKGMRWGVTTKSNGGNTTVSKKPTTNDILSARAKVASKQRRINTQIDKTNLASGKQQDREAKKLNEMSMDFLNDPDRATSLRMTTGEKLGLGVLAVAIPGIGTGAAAGAVAGRVAVRKGIERQQRRAGVKKY